jgi:peroxiredoxin
MRRQRSLSKGRLFCLLGVVAFLVTSASAAGPGLGSVFQNFTLEDQNAYRVSFTDFKGQTVVLEWMNPDCPAVKRLYDESFFKSIAEKFKRNGFVYIAINSTSYSDRFANKKWLEEHHLPYSILDDHLGRVAKMYGVETVPYMMIFDTSGKLVYKGAPDDDEKGQKGSKRVNFVEKALNELLAGKPVGLPETAAYGCKIEFAE